MHCTRSEEANPIQIYAWFIIYFLKKIFFINLLSPFWDCTSVVLKQIELLVLYFNFFLWRLEIANLFYDFISSNLVCIILKDLNVIVLVTLDNKDQNN